MKLFFIFRKDYATSQGNFVGNVELEDGIIHGLGRYGKMVGVVGFVSKKDAKTYLETFSSLAQSCFEVMSVEMPKRGDARRTKCKTT